MSDSDVNGTTFSLGGTVSCALLSAWDQQGIVPSGLLASQLESFQQTCPGLHPVGGAHFAVLPEAGDPAVFDTATSWAERIQLHSPTQGAEQLGGVLISSAKAQLSKGRVEILPCKFLKNLHERAPTFETRGTYLTAIAASRLERPHFLDRVGTYVTAADQPIPLFRPGAPNFGTASWRNPEVLGRKVNWVPRPTLERQLFDMRNESAIRIEGPLGCGKTRLVAETLAKLGDLRLWTRSLPARGGDSTLAQQMLQQIIDPNADQQQDSHHPRLSEEFPDDELRQLLEEWQRGQSQSDWLAMAEWAGLTTGHLVRQEGTRLRLILDDLEHLTVADAEILTRLLRSPRLGSGFQLILLRRPGTAWPPACEELPLIAVPALTQNESRPLADQLVQGLSLPAPVVERFLEAAGGFPLAMEEGLLQLVRDRHIRQIYGSFFFSGPEDTPYQPSARLSRHMIAEVSRMEDPEPMYLLAATGAAVPADELAAATSTFGKTPSPGWAKQGISSGLLRLAESSWGKGVGFACPALGQALAKTLEPNTVQQISNQLGELLSGLSHGGQAQWRAYRLLTGSPEAIEPLLATLKSSFAAKIEEAELVDALSCELEHLKAREPDNETELTLLWNLLKLARQRGSLEGYSQQLERALALASSDPRKLLALASLKAELDQASGRFKEAESTIQSALAAAHGKDPRRQALLLSQLGKMMLRQERYSQARALFENLLQTIATDDNPGMASSCEFYLGNIALRENRLQQALEYHLASLKTRREQKAVKQLGSSLCALGAVSIARGNYPQSLNYYEEAEGILQEHGREGELGFSLLGAGRAYMRLGDYTAATQPLKKALELRAGKDDVAGEAIVRLALAENYLHLGRLKKALDGVRKAHFDLTMLPIGWLQAYAEQLLGRIVLQQRDYETATQHLKTALKSHRALSDQVAIAFDQVWLLQVALQMEERSSIRSLVKELEVSVEHLGECEHSELLGFTLFSGLEWLQKHDCTVADPAPFLERAYEAVLKKAAHLAPDQRHQFLFQVSNNQAILTAASERGMALP